jgi:hypothetical protein
MVISATKLDQLFERVRALPETRQQLAVAALEDVLAEPYLLADDELFVLLPALADVDGGRSLTDLADANILNKPWA